MTPAGYRIRRGALVDSEAIAQVHVKAWNESYRGILADSILDQYQLPQRLVSRRRVMEAQQSQCFVAEHGNAGIIGFADCGAAREPIRGCAGEVWAVYIVKAHQKVGLGRALMAECAEALAAQGMASLMVWVVEGNTAARAFYERLGGELAESGRDSHGNQSVRKFAYCWPDLSTLRAR